MVPAFAVERTQKFLFMVKELMESGRAPRVPVYGDSPMAIQAVEVFLKHTKEYSDTTKQLISRYGSPLAWPGFHFALTAEESKKINQSKFPCIIVSSSVTGGQDSASSRAEASGPAKHRDLYWIPGAGNPGL